jgi:hypothetical protein
MNRFNKNPSRIVPLTAPDGLFGSMDELEARLESQIAALPTALDDDYCLYYLCTTRCSGTKCPVYCPCDVRINLGGIGDDR